MEGNDAQDFNWKLRSLWEDSTGRTNSVHKSPSHARDMMKGFLKILIVLHDLYTKYASSTSPLYESKLKILFSVKNIVLGHIRYEFGLLLATICSNIYIVLL